MFRNFEFQSQSLHAFKQAEGAIGVGTLGAGRSSTSSARGLSALATVEVAAWRPRQIEVPSSIKTG